MYLENVYKGKSPKWLYFIFPVLFIFLTLFSFLATFIIDIDKIFAQEIAEKGELPFFTENLGQFAIFFVILLVWVKFVHQQPLVAFTTSRPKIDFKRLFFAFFLWGSFSSGLIFLDFWFSPSNYQWNFDLLPFLKLCLISVIFIPLQASFEEYFFRAYMMQGAGYFTKNRWLPLIISSLIFGFAHIANPEIAKLGYGLLFYYIGTGLFLGIITLLDEGIELAMGFHIANNLFSAILVTSNWSVFRVPSLLKSIAEPTIFAEIFLSLFICFPILGFILYKKYKWKNLKEKLTGKIITENEFLQEN